MDLTKRQLEWIEYIDSLSDQEWADLKTNLKNILKLIC